MKGKINYLEFNDIIDKYFNILSFCSIFFSFSRSLFHYQSETEFLCNYALKNIALSQVQ